MTAASDSNPTRHARRNAHAPRPLPGWLQVGVVLLLLWNGLQAIVHLNGPSLAANTDQAAASAPQTRFEYYYQPDRLPAAAPQERTAYDPYGAVRAISSGSQLATFQYAGYYAHAPGAVSVMPVHAYAPSTGRYYTRDHEGSVREMCNSSGTIVARYSYDPYGVTTLVQGTNLATKQYAGMYMHQPSGFYLTRFRAFDPNTGRWLSRDPLDDAERSQGPNLYGYVLNDPIDEIDPIGLTYADAERAFAESVTIEGDEEAAGWLGGGNFDPLVNAGLGLTALGLGAFDLYELLKPGSSTMTECHSKFPSGYWEGDKGAAEWGRKNGVGAKEGKDRFHGIKQGDPMSGATDDYGVDPVTGDVIDPEGQSIGNLNDGKAK